MTSDSDSDGKEKSTLPDEQLDLHDISLAETRLRYQEEEDRRKAAEAKIGIVLTVNAIIISVISIFSDLNVLHYLAMVFALASVIIGISALWVRDYHQPGKETEDHLQYIDDPPENLKRELVKSYITVITGNEEADDPEKYFKGNETLNDEKIAKLDWSLKLTIGSLLCILLATGLSTIDGSETAHINSTMAMSVIF